MAAPSRVSIPRTADAVRLVLAEYRPALCEQFTSEFHTAMAETDDDFRTARIDRLVGRWWAQACALLNPDPALDVTQQRIQAGDTRDLAELWQPQGDGSQHAYRRDNRGEWVFHRVIPAA